MIFVWIAWFFQFAVLASSRFIVKDYKYYINKDVGYWNHSLEQNGDDVIVSDFLALYKEIPAVILNIVLEVTRGKDSEPNNIMHHNATVNVCHYLTGSFESIIMKVVAKDFFKHMTNVPEKCPFLKGNYTVNNYIISDKYVPDAALNMVVRSCHVKLAFIFHVKFGKRPLTKQGELIVWGKFTKTTRSTIV